LPGAELTLKLSFDARRFSPDSIERALGHVRAIIAAMAADPERRLGDLPWMLDSEREQLIGRWDRLSDEPMLHELDLDHLSEEELDALIDRLR
jgi:hypothetical protein